MRRGRETASREKTEEAENLRPDVPAENAQLGMARLSVNDVAQIEAACHQQNANHRHRQRQFVADHLRRAAQSAKKRVLAVGGPTCKSHSVNAQCGYGEERENADVQIEWCNAKIDFMAEDLPRQRVRPERNDGDGR